MGTRLTALLLAGALILALSACAPAGEVLPPETTPAPTQTARPEPARAFTLPRSEGTLHPILSQDAANVALSGLVWEGLFALDGSFEPQPVLCQGYTVSEDGLTWTFTLRSGVTFSDGSPLTADEAAASLRLAMGESSRFSGRMGGVRSVTSQDGAVVVTLNRPNGALPALLDIPIVKGESEEPLGTGPYVVEGWGEDSRLTARSDWWQNKPLPVQTIPLYTVPEPDDLIYAFDAGDISLVSTDLTGTNALGFGGDYETWDYPTSTMLYVGFNCNAGACRDPAVRQALSRGLDRNSVASALYARHAVASALPVHPAAACYDETAAAALDYAPQALADGLTAAGWSKGEDGLWARGRERLSLTFVVSTDNTFRLTAAEYLAGELTRAGIGVELQKLSWTDYQKALAQGDFDLYLGAVTLSADFDPTPLLSGALNYGKYWNADTNALTDAYRAAAGPARETAAAALWARLAQEAPFAVLCFQNQSVLTQWGMVSGLTPTQQNPFYGFAHWSVGSGG